MRRVTRAAAETVHLTLALCVAITTATASRASTHKASRVSLLTNSLQSAPARFALNRATSEAVHRLERSECRKVLSDFRDASGRTIQMRLDLLEETPRSYLTRIAFREALDRRCQDSAKLAFTTVGSREVFICGTQFWQTYRNNPSHVEALVIHEMMHTLGLGENPPSSMEITARVLARCW